MGAVRTPSVSSSAPSPGTGRLPKPTDYREGHYHGTLTDGTVFDSACNARARVFPLNQVIPCWTERLADHEGGGKSRLVCPSTIALRRPRRPAAIKPRPLVLVFRGFGRWLEIVNR